MLNEVFNIAASGLAAAGAQLAATAGNIANADTPSYQARRVDLVELSTGGVAVAGVSRDTAPGDPGSSNVDLARESIDLVRERALYTANAAVLRTADRMTGTLLDLLDTDHNHDHSHARA